MNEARKISQEVADLQRLLLPKEFPIFPGYSFAIHYQPCEAAGGDFYGWQLWDDGTLGIGVADVAGHGIRAAVVMAMLRACIASYKHFHRPPEMILEDLNGFFTEIGDLNTFVTCVFTRLEPVTGKFSFRNCGHPAPKIRRRDGTIETVHQGRSLPIGILIEEKELVPPATGQLQPGDAIVLYTDGIPESTAEDGSFFDDQRLDTALQNASGTADSIVASINQSLQTHRGKRRRRDDECILVILRD